MPRRGSRGQPLHLKPDSRPGDRPVAGAPGSVSLSDLSHLVGAGVFDPELRLIAEQAQMLTLASGAAIALRQEELLVCRARAGNMAPALGAQLEVQSGLSGECVRRASTLVCADTENDSRVNLDVCRYLGIRSMAVLPICLGREVVGVFEVFAPKPGAFSGNEVAALESMRDLVISVIRPEPQEESAGSALAARAAEEKPPAAGFRPSVIADPEDDLLCEIEQRAPAKSESTPQARAFQLIKAESQQPPALTPRVPAPFANPDPEDDLICEIEMRPVRPAAPQAHPAHALRGFAPAPLNLPEHTISRKLIVAGVVVALIGLVWLRWCNRSPNASGATQARTAGATKQDQAPGSRTRPHRRRAQAGTRLGGEGCTAQLRGTRFAGRFRGANHAVENRAGGAQCATRHGRAANRSVAFHIRGGYAAGPAHAPAFSIAAGTGGSRPIRSGRAVELEPGGGEGCPAIGQRQRSKPRCSEPAAGISQSGRRRDRKSV